MTKRSRLILLHTNAIFVIFCPKIISSWGKKVFWKTEHKINEKWKWLEHHKSRAGVKMSKGWRRRLCRACVRYELSVDRRNRGALGHRRRRRRKPARHVLWSFPLSKLWLGSVWMLCLALGIMLLNSPNLSWLSWREKGDALRSRKRDLGRVSEMLGYVCGIRRKRGLEEISAAKKELFSVTTVDELNFLSNIGHFFIR